jgi:UPF0755 protein
LSRLGVAVTVFVSALIIAAGGATWVLNAYLHAPLKVAESGTEFEIMRGEPFGKISRELAARGIISRPRWLRAYARVTGKAGAVQAGDYRIMPGSTPISMLEQFTSGDVQLYSLTIIEGWNHRDLLDALRGHPMIAATMTDTDWPAFLAELGTNAVHPEGLFLPETYRFPKNISDRTILKQAYALMHKTLEDEWRQRAQELPINNPYDALILASIVEKETARPDERDRIAGVFVRRLEKRMRLQTDPTVIYGIGPAFDGNLTRQHLETDTPYNTYTRNGLPPTPIALPGRAAIHAALHPAEGDELYFVATGLGDGSHRFSSSKAEHDAAVADYLSRLRRRRLQGN